MKHFFFLILNVVVCCILAMVLLGCHSSSRQNVEETPMMKGIRLVNEQCFEEAYNQFGIARCIAHFKGDEEGELLALKGQADCAFWIGDADSCIDRYLLALPLAQRLNKPDEEFLIYMQLKQAYLAKVDMRNVMIVAQKADSLAKASTDMRLMVRLQRQLAQEALQQRNPRLAEYYYLENEILLESKSQEMLQTEQFSVYGDLRDYYFSQQKLDKAREYSRKCIESIKKNFGQQQLAYMCYDSEALICAHQHNRKDAFGALDSMKYGLTLKVGAGKSNEMHYHEIRGNVYSIFGEWKKASKEYKKALKAVDDTYVKYRADYYRIMRMLGVALCNSKKYSEARNILLDVIVFNRIMYGDESLATVNALLDMAYLESKSGNNSACKRSYEWSVDICKKIVASQLRYVSVQERETFWYAFAPQMFGMTAYAIKNGERQNEFTKKCYEALLFSKSLLLESDRTMATAISEDCAPEEQNIYSEMLRLQNQLKVLSNDYERNKNRIDELHRKISALNQQLTPIISRLGYTSFLSLVYSDIKDLLKEDEVLLDYTDFISDEQMHQHAVFVVNRKQKNPKLIDGFTEEQVNELLNGRDVYYLYKTSNAEKTLKILWEPLAKEVQGKRTVYYVPAGILHQIALEDIPLKDGTLLGDHYSFVRLTSAREIVKKQNKGVYGTRISATLYGGLKYDMDTTQMIYEAAHNHIDPYNAGIRGVTVRGGGRFNDLPNTKREIDGIEAILRKNHISVTSKSGIKGTEESFWKLSKKAPSILHIATHGFYYTPEKANETTYLKGYNDAMLLSGLIMSGGNLAWTGMPIPNGVMGGVLTANSIASMDLRGTDMVVLSACQTGLGNATPEGIYGLQRAFKKAGVQTIVMSLWNISDNVTKDFMLRFYEELTNKQNHGDKRMAFEKAKKSIRSKPDYCDPYYWAGFVMLD